MKKSDSVIEEIGKILERHFAGAAGVFIPGVTPVTTGMAFYDNREIGAVLASLLDGWLGIAEKGACFEESFARFIGVDHCVMVNSGSSANLAAIDAIKTYRKIKGGHVITTAAAFPSTINPVIQRGFTPVLVDVDDTLNIDVSEIERAIDGDTRGIVLAHALGNPADMQVIMDLAERHGLFVLEDCCSALGSLIGANACGSFGLASTFSFNPTHGMTTGEGGAVLTGDADLEKIVRGMRDWGRECTCVRTGDAYNGSCGRRFDVKLGDVEYDHRYIYSTMGYNLRTTEMQAAMGLVQLEKLEAFNKARRENYRKYLKALEPFSGHFSFAAVHEGAEPAWMGLPVILTNEQINRRELLLYLNRHRIETRLFFAGNVLLQPAYREVEFIVKSSLSRTETVLKNCFWIGLHPGIDETVIDYVASVFGKFIKEKGL